jgi:hypothetical protein
MLVGYKYSEEECSPGELVVARQDHLPDLSPDKQKTELAIRAGDARGPLRACAVYAFADLAVAQDLLAETDGQHLYEMVIDGRDVIHQADLRIYDEIVEALKAGRSAHELVAEFWRGRRRPVPRIELCVRRMTVRRRLVHKDEKQRCRFRATRTRSRS